MTSPRTVSHSQQRPKAPARPWPLFRSASTSGYTSRAVNAASHPERPWTLFGQLMHDGTQLASSPRRLSHSPDVCLHTRASSHDIHGAGGDESPTPTPSWHPVELDDDTDSDSCTSESEDSAPPRPQAKWFPIPPIPTIPPLYRNILKCSIAYFIASLFTFSPYLSRLLSDLSSYGPGPHTPSPSGHLVASMCVL
jgi:hypothetical protein